MEFTTKSAKETKKLGEKIGADLKGGETLALVGDLGSGKTTFVQGLAKGLGIDQRVVSPTFILVRKYGIGIRNNELGIMNFYHIDLYRLEGDVEKELANLGFKEIVSGTNNIVVVEWAGKAIGVYPENTVWIEFENLGEDKRKITVKS